MLCGKNNCQPGKSIAEYARDFKNQSSAQKAKVAMNDETMSARKDRGPIP